MIRTWCLTLTVLRPVAPKKHTCASGEGNASRDGASCTRELAVRRLQFAELAARADVVGIALEPARVVAAQEKWPDSARF